MSPAPLTVCPLSLPLVRYRGVLFPLGNTFFRFSFGATLRFFFSDPVYQKFNVARAPCHLLFPFFVQTSPPSAPRSHSENCTKEAFFLNTFFPLLCHRQWLLLQHPSRPSRAFAPPNPSTNEEARSQIAIPVFSFTLQTSLATDSLGSNSSLWVSIVNGHLQ